MWSVGHYNLQRDPVTNRSITTGVNLVFPDSLPLGASQLDSALARYAIAVWEYDGEPATLVRMTEPDARAIYFAEDRLHLTLVGAEAVNALLTSARDSIRFTWCDQSSPITRTVPITRR
jgi:hypothetical protein